MRVWELWLSCLSLLIFLHLPVSGEGLLASKSVPTDFILSTEKEAATIYIESATNPAVARAARDLVSDIEQVTSHRPTIVSDANLLSGDVVLVGVIGQSPVLDSLIAQGKLDVSGVKGCWETCVIATVESPLPSVRRALVIVGSDRRAAIYGLYEISAAIGVSPWYWWADVPPAKRTQLVITGGIHRIGPPSVKYRGIFINDEDWGLQPWAAKTFEPEHGGIGPKTYAKVFELLLRLKANTLWPAMHACSPQFNAFPENATLADQYAIVMGSSHAEPMLRNNVREWKDAPEKYDYISNRDGVLKYWEERIRANGRFENMYTLGMRGIHDSEMQGPKGNAERVRTLERIFADQRSLLARHVSADVEQVPQVFCAYKEVLPLYRGGLKVPDDVTVMFPDDNFGYIRDFPSAIERTRAGGFGVYYHLSYLGAPMSDLWLCTTPPALIWEEMVKAYACGVDRIWIANIGDIKPAEIATEFFLDLAWDVHRWDNKNPSDFLNLWATREFGAENSAVIAAMLCDYYHLNYQRKPEQLQWWLPGKTPQSSPLTTVEIHKRLEAFTDLRARADSLLNKIAPEKRNAFFELVDYPIRGSALANERYFCGELSASEANQGTVASAELAARAQSANAQLMEQTRIFNEKIAGGKWYGMMSLEPADSQWAVYRPDPWSLPRFISPNSGRSVGKGSHVMARDAGHFDRKTDRPSARWEVIAGLGRTGNAITVFPLNASAIDANRVATDSPVLEYDLNFVMPGEFPISFYLVPTHPLSGGALRFAVALDQAAPRQVAVVFNDGGPEWAQGVLNATRIAKTSLSVPSPGTHTLKVFMVDAGVAIDKIVVGVGGDLDNVGYLGTPDNALP